MGGPIWIEPIHDAQFVGGLLQEVKAAPQDMYNTTSRIKGLLSVVSEVSVHELGYRISYCTIQVQHAI